MMGCFDIYPISTIDDSGQDGALLDVDLAPNTRCDIFKSGKGLFAKLDGNCSFEFA